MSTSRGWLETILGLGLLATAGANGMPLKTAWYVNNRTGSDAYDGRAETPAAGGKVGPFRTIMQAVRQADVGAYIEIANTGDDYREQVEIAGTKKGRPDNPLVLEGHGATVSGLVEVEMARWDHFRDDIYSFANRLGGTDYVSRAWYERRIGDAFYGAMPNSNWLGHWSHQGWFTEKQAPEIFFLNGKPGPHVRDLTAIPQGGFFYDTTSSPRRLYFRLPAGAKLGDCRVELPIHQGVFVSDDYVVIRDLASKYSQDDGFSGFWAQGVVLVNVNGSFNCDQGISFHGTSGTLIDGGLFERNGGCGIADVMSCVTIYRNVVVRDNMIMGALLQGFAHSLLNCRFCGNYATQIRGATAMNLTECQIVGNGGVGKEDIGISLCEAARLDHCTIVNCRQGVVVESGKASIRNSVLAGCTNALIAVKPAAMGGFHVAKSVFGPGTVALGTNKLNTVQWAALTNSAPGFADSAAESLALAAPLYLLPTNSPNLKHAEYGLTPGADALTTPYAGWQPLGP